MEIVEIIKAELKRRKKMYDGCAAAAGEKNLPSALESNELASSICDSLLSFIESAQKETKNDTARRSGPRWIHAGYSSKPEIRFTHIDNVPYLQNGAHFIWLSDLENLPKDGSDLTNPAGVPDVKSPFTGGKVTLESKEDEVLFRGEKITVSRQYYRCVDTGKEFTTNGLDDDMMWAVVRAYCEKKCLGFRDLLPDDKAVEADYEKLYENAKQQVCQTCPNSKGECVYLIRHMQDNCPLLDDVMRGYEMCLEDIKKTK